MVANQIPLTMIWTWWFVTFIARKVDIKNRVEWLSSYECNFAFSKWLRSVRDLGLVDTDTKPYGVLKHFKQMVKSKPYC